VKNVYMVFEEVRPGQPETWPQPNVPVLIVLDPPALFTSDGVTTRVPVAVAMMMFTTDGFCQRHPLRWVVHSMKTADQDIRVFNLSYGIQVELNDVSGWVPLDQFSTSVKTDAGRTTVVGTTFEFDPHENPRRLCLECEGTGLTPLFAKCSACSGTGDYQGVTPEAVPQQEHVLCQTCNGRGDMGHNYPIGNVVCVGCDGLGVVNGDGTKVNAGGNSDDSDIPF
jgi:hypothetical protein